MWGQFCGMFLNFAASKSPSPKTPAKAPHLFMGSRGMVPGQSVLHNGRKGHDLGERMRIDQAAARSRVKNQTEFFESSMKGRLNSSNMP